MHRFGRGEPPVDFEKVASKCATWGDFRAKFPTEHAQVGDVLYRRQNGFCAYCDCAIADKVKDGHIEHRERISDNDGRMFDWTNMFFSSNHSDSCGVYKDREAGSFKVEDVLDPSVESPLDYLEYDVLGGVAAKPNITAAAQRRAEETIRVFNLDQSARLRGSRRQVGETINCLLSSNPTQEEIVSFLDSVRSFEYFSVYCSLLGHYVPIPKTNAY